MNRLRMCVLILATFMLSGCYIATVDTGQPKSSKVISKPWASCWIYGLVPPTTIQTATECPNGVAMATQRTSRGHSRTRSWPTTRSRSWTRSLGDRLTWSVGATEATSG